MKTTNACHVDDKQWRIEKRVANTDRWGVVGFAGTKEGAIAKAQTVIGGQSTGVRICQTDTPHRTPTVVVGV